MPGEPVDVPLVARLHPVRGPGLCYGLLAVLVLVLVLAGAGTNLVRGHLVTAFVLLVVGLALTAFLGILSLAILGPVLVLGPEGVAGRVGLRRPVDLDWDEVTIDAEPDARRRFRLDLGVETFAVDSRSWTGFRDFVLVVASTPAALARSTPPATDELARLLGFDEPDGAPTPAEG